MTQWISDSSGTRRTRLDIHLSTNPIQESVEEPRSLFSPGELTNPTVHEWPDNIHDDDLIGQIDVDVLMVEALEAQKANKNDPPVSHCYTK